MAGGAEVQRVVVRCSCQAPGKPSLYDLSVRSRWADHFSVP